MEDRRALAGSRRRAVRRPWGIPVGRIGGIPIVVAPSWLISAVIIVVLAAPIVDRVVPGLSRGAGVAVAILLAILLGLSVLAHELGHCAAARAQGVPVTEVRLYLVGGASELGRLPATAKEEALIAAAGPGVSALLAVLCGLLVGSTESRTVAWLVLLELAVANGLVAVFNILPALPLDGGRVLRALVWAVFRRPRAGTLAAAIGGVAVMAALLVWAAIALAQGSRAGLLQAALIAVMALFVGVGAIAEWPRRRRDVDPLVGGSLRPLTAPLVPLAAHTPLDAALAVAAGRPVLVTDPDGIAVGIVGPVLTGGLPASAVGQAPESASSRLARADPTGPVAAAAVPISPEMVVLPGEGLEVAYRRCRDWQVPYIVVTGDDGRPEGIVMRSRIEQAARIPGSAPDTAPRP